MKEEVKILMEKQSPAGRAKEGGGGGGMGD